MNREENIRAILECIFAGFREELIDVAVKSICELNCEENEVDQTLSDTVETLRHQGKNTYE